MPITLYPSEKPLSSIVNTTAYGPAKDPRDLLERSCEDVFRKCGEIFQSSFAASRASSTKASEERFAATILSESTVFPVGRGNGFVSIAVCAYNQHHHLVIRPDDVWIAILAQFSLYVNANAEELRHLFVEHEGKKELIIETCGSRYTVHFGAFAEKMSRLLQKNVKDIELREWIIPAFSTTTQNDVIVSSVLMMATLKAYFSFTCCMTCGLPAVTLLGEKADWETLLVKTEKLPQYGEQTALWHSLLKPVLGAFVRSFDEPTSQRTKDFWQSIAHYIKGGSGPTYLSGWITAFCFFDSDGRPPYSSGAVGGQDYWDISDDASDETSDETLNETSKRQALQLDGVQFHTVDTSAIPRASAEVDVKLLDNGEEIRSIMVAGLVGMEVSDSGIENGKESDTVQPVAGWWLFEETPEKDPLEEEMKEWETLVAAD